jgi:hypothetical protein
MKFGIFAICALAGVVMIYFGITGLPASDVSTGLIDSPTTVLGRDRVKKTKSNFTDMLTWGGFVLLAAGGGGMLFIHLTRPKDKDDTPPPQN